MTNATPERVNILNEAADLIVGQRQQDYGTPDENFQRLADLVNIVIKKNLETNTPLSPRQMADILILLKVARTINTPTHDSYVDIAGYAGIAGELAKSEKDLEELISLKPEDLEVSTENVLRANDIASAKAAHPSNGVG